MKTFFKRFKSKAHCFGFCLLMSMALLMFFALWMQIAADMKISPWWLLLIAAVAWLTCKIVQVWRIMVEINNELFNEDLDQ
jgi:hypothetical protein